jgi:hypothetical protein
MYEVTANWIRLKIRWYIFPAKGYAFHRRHFAGQYLELTYRIENSDSNEMCARRSDMLISPNRYIPAGTCMYTRVHVCIRHPHIPGDSEIKASSLGGEIIDQCEKKYWMFLLINSVYVSVCVHTCVRVYTRERTYAHTRARTHTHTQTHKAIQEGRSIFCDVIVSVIVRQEVHTNMCLVPNGYQHAAVWI